MGKYHYFYKITNTVNNHFYYGVHNTNNLEDGYMGSGKRLHLAYQKYGIENFRKDILLFFNTKEEAYEYEAKYVTEQLVKTPECYNLVVGGRGSFIKSCNQNKVRVLDSNNKCIVVDKADPRYSIEELPGIAKDRIVAKNKITGEVRSIKREEFVSKADVWEPANKNTITVKDKRGIFFKVSVDDPRYLSGEMVPIWLGRKHSLEARKKMSLSRKGTKMGSENSQYGTCWIHNETQNKKIKLSDLQEYLNNGWAKGMIAKLFPNYKHNRSKRHIS